MNNNKHILIIEDELVVAENTKILIQELYQNVTIEIAGGFE